LLPLGGAITRLRKYYGAPARPPTADPFELILFENVAYLAPPARRREAFEVLKQTIGTSPAAILAASPQALESVTARGIMKGTSAAKLRDCARIVVEDLDGNIGSQLEVSLPAAKRALRRFPGIGEPGAEKILLFAGRQALLAPDSNGLRVLVRLGLVREHKSYATTYAGSHEAAKALPAKPRVLQEAHLLLQQHGQALCKRTAPLCDSCPLATGCAYGQRV
jgi:endonuclease III